MELVAVFDDLAKRFRPLQHDSTFQITYIEDDPRTLAESAGRDAEAIMRNPTAMEIHRDAADAARWASLAAHFAGIALAGNTTTEQDAELRAIADSYGHQAIRATGPRATYDPAADETAYRFARTAARAAAMVIEGWREIGPVITASSPNLVARFRKRAAAAAKAAGLVTATAREDAAVRAWCDELRRRLYFGPLGILTQPAEASAQLCEDFAEEAPTRTVSEGEERDSTKNSSPSPEPKLPSVRGRKHRPKSAKALQDLMGDRKWKDSDLEVDRFLTRKTVRNMRKNHPTKDSSWDKLKHVLRDKGVKEADIPTGDG